MLGKIVVSLVFVAIFGGTMVALGLAANSESALGQVGGTVGALFGFILLTRIFPKLKG